MDARRARSFGSAAQEYDAGRPSYPVDAVRWALPAQPERVLDLGAGTGKVSRVLAELGIEAVAVEPDDAMRARIETESMAGSAEAIPLPDASVDSVLVGQAFHWFDPGRALPEMVRVLRPGGTIGLLWNLFDDEVPWVAEFCDRFGAEARVTIARQFSDPPYDATAYGMEDPQRRLVPHSQQVDRELLALQLRSISHFILLPEGEREAAIDAALARVPTGAFALPYVCDVWRATKA